MNRKQTASTILLVSMIVAVVNLVLTLAGVDTPDYIGTLTLLGVITGLMIERKHLLANQRTNVTTRRR
jgi:uncharacterized protein YebE (UPF0316 family)